METIKALELAGYAVIHGGGIKAVATNLATGRRIHFYTNGAKHGTGYQFHVTNISGSLSKNFRTIKGAMTGKVA